MSRVTISIDLAKIVLTRAGPTPLPVSGVELGPPRYSTYRHDLPRRAAPAHDPGCAAGGGADRAAGGIALDLPMWYYVMLQLVV